MKIKESQPCVNYKRLKRKGGSEEWKKGTDWSAEVFLNNMKEEEQGRRKEEEETLGEEYW